MTCDAVDAVALGQLLVLGLVGVAYATGRWLEKRRVFMSYKDMLGDRIYSTPQPAKPKTTVEMLTPKAAIETRDAVLSEVEENAREDGWLDYAMGFFDSVCPPGTEGKTEDFRKTMLERGLRPPHSPNVWGMFTKLLLKDQRLLFLRYEAMQAKGSNGRKTAVYRVLPADEADAA